MASRHKKPDNSKRTKKIVGLTSIGIVAALTILFLIDLAIVKRNANQVMAKGDFTNQDRLNARAKRVKTMEVEQNRKLSGNPIRAKELERKTRKQAKDPEEKKERESVRAEKERVMEARENSISPTAKRRMEEAQQRKIAARQRIREREKARQSVMEERRKKRN